MAVTLINNDSITMQSLEDFRRDAASQPNTVYRKNNRQVDINDIKDGDKVSVVVKASGNRL